MKTLTSNAAGDQPDRDLYATYRTQYQSVMGSAASVMRAALRFTGRN